MARRSVYLPADIDALVTHHSISLSPLLQRAVIAECGRRGISIDNMRTSIDPNPAKPKGWDQKERLTVEGSWDGGERNILAADPDHVPAKPQSDKERVDEMVDQWRAMKPT